ncbi:MAG TPA: head decoration protein [Armatimonadota bacterium]|jgi:hypothetical protein
MPTAPVATFSNKRLEPYEDPKGAVLRAVKLTASQTLARGTVLGEVTLTPGVFSAYNDAHNDGTEVAKCILSQDVVVDAAGLITVTATAGQSGGEHGEKLLSIPTYVAGTFKTSELIGLDANGVADLGRLLQGSVADGILRMA